MNEKKQIEEMAKVIASVPPIEFPIGSRMQGRLIHTTTKIAEHLYTAGYRKQEWISVEERLPEEKVNCLVHYKHAYCDNDGYWDIGVSFYDGHEFHIGLEYKVTHWMPLPEAPKMKGGAE